MTSEQRASERITEEVTSWPGVTAGPGQAGGVRVQGRRARDRPPARRPRRALRLSQGGLGRALRAGADRLPPGLPRQAGLRRAQDRDRGRRRGRDRADAPQLRPRRRPPRPPESRQPPSRSARRHRHRRIARARARARPCPRRARLAAGRRRARSRCARARRRRPRGRRSRSRATSPTPGTAGRSSRRRATGSTCSSTTRACSGRARSRRSPPIRSRSSRASTRSNVLAPLALVQEALPRLAPGRGDPQRHLRCGGRAVRGLGRLRLLEGRARAADGDPRRRAAAAARLQRRPGRHAHADLPGGVPGRGHLRPAAAGGERAGPARADRGLASERPLPGAELVRRSGVSALELPVRLEAHEPPEARGAGRDDVALLVATRHDLALVHARFRELPRFLSAGDLLVVNTSATLPAALDARLGERRLRALALDPGAGRHLARRAANERPGAATRGRPCEAGSTYPAAPTPSCSHAFAGSERLVGRPPRARRAARGLPAPSRPADPLRLRPRRRGRSTHTRPCSPCEPGQRGDAERRPAVHGGARRPSSSRAAS